MLGWNGTKLLRLVKCCTYLKEQTFLRTCLLYTSVTDVLAKSKGSSNPHNLVKATSEALSEMRDARMRCV